MCDNKHKRDCPKCGVIITYNRTDAFKNATNKNTNCLTCTSHENRKYINNNIFDDEVLLENLKYLYMNTNMKITEICEDLGVSPTTYSKMKNHLDLPKRKRVASKHNRLDAYKKRFKTIRGVEYDEFLKSKGDFYKYRNRVDSLTKKTIKEYGVILGDLSLVGKSDGSHHIDHIVSVRDCFDYGLEPHIVTHIINLRTIPKKENLSKGSKSVFSPEILEHNVLEIIKNKIYI